MKIRDYIIGRHEISRFREKYCKSLTNFSIYVKLSIEEVDNVMTSESCREAITRMLQNIREEATLEKIYQYVQYLYIRTGR